MLNAGAEAIVAIIEAEAITVEAPVVEVQAV